MSPYLYLYEADASRCMGDETELFCLCGLCDFSNAHKKPKAFPGTISSKTCV